MSKKHEIIFETDGRHSSVYLYEPPMGIRQYVEPIDEVLDPGSGHDQLRRGGLRGPAV